jgi:hypothetical protein
LKFGEHGLPLIGSGDWNDGMTLVGAEGKGESVWLAQFLILVLRSFIPICENRGESEKAKRYNSEVEKIKNAIKAAYAEGENKLKGNGKTVPPLASLKTPLRDGDEERPDDEAYANCLFVNANSDTAPGIVDRDRNPIMERSEIYSGIYARFSINFYVFNTNGNKGIACGLNNLQKLSDGVPLGGKSKPEDDFASDYNDDDFLS